MSTAAIATEKLSKTYHVGFVRKRRVLALRSLDFVVEPGQIYGLLGPNGAGKSTTIKLLLNLIRPTSGSAKLFGQLASSTEARRQIGFLPENPAPYEYLTGREFVGFAGRLSGLSGSALGKNVERVIEQVGMKDAQGLQIRRYSKGMIQRISLAQALVSEPRLLVLDEPTSGLDVLGRQLMRDIILEQRRKGTTVLFCSHIIPDVEALCDRVAVLIGGELIKEGKVAELLAGEQSLMEASVENMPAALLESLGARLKFQEKVGEKHLLRFEEHDEREVLSALLQSGARLAQLQRTRYSLEELFLKAVKESGRNVGSVIS